MLKKTEAGIKRKFKPNGIIVGAAAALCTMMAMLLLSAILISGERAEETAMAALSNMSLFIGVFVGALAGAKKSKNALAAGMSVAAIFAAIRLITGAFGDGGIFNMHTLCDVLLIAVAGMCGGALGRRKRKKRRN